LHETSEIPKLEVLLLLSKATNCNVNEVRPGPHNAKKMGAKVCREKENVHEATKTNKIHTNTKLRPTHRKSQTATHNVQIFFQKSNLLHKPFNTTKKETLLLRKLADNKILTLRRS
jgi:hypothetical protein